MISQSIGLSATMPVRQDGTWSSASAFTSFWWAILLIRGSSLNPSRCANAKPGRHWPVAVGVLADDGGVGAVPQTRSIIAATSEALQDRSWE